MTKHVYLDSKYEEFVIDDETYEDIEALVRAAKLCVHDYHNRHTYSLDNPCVGKGICLNHMLVKRSNLTLLDSPGQDSYGRNMYRFTDAAGFIYTSTEDSTEDPHNNVQETLAYHHFPLPEKVTSRGKTVDFNTYYARFYGKLDRSVLVLSFDHTQEKVKGLFLLYKDGGVKEFTRRADVYHQAEELVEANKDKGGQYHIGSYPHYCKFDSDIFEVISELESAVYDVTLKFKKNGKKDETP